MELKPLLNNSFSKVFKLFPDVIPLVDYIRIERAGVDPETGEATPEREVVTKLNAFFENFEKKRIAAGEVTSQDQKVTILASSLPVKPEIGHRIVKDGSTYEVTDVTSDPAGISFVLETRV